MLSKRQHNPILSLSSGVMEEEGHTVRVHRFSIRRTDAEDTRNQDILETRQQEQGRVLVIEGFQLFVVDVRRGVPGFTSDQEKD